MQLLSGFFCIERKVQKSKLYTLCPKSLLFLPFSLLSFPPCHITFPANTSPFRRSGKSPPGIVLPFAARAVKKRSSMDGAPCRAPTCITAGPRLAFFNNIGIPAERSRIGFLRATFRFYTCHAFPYHEMFRFYTCNVSFPYRKRFVSIYETVRFHARQRKFHNTKRKFHFFVKTLFISVNIFPALQYLFTGCKMPYASTAGPSGLVTKLDT